MEMSLFWAKAVEAVMMSRSVISCFIGFGKVEISFHRRGAAASQRTAEGKESTSLPNFSLCTSAQSLRLCGEKKLENKPRADLQRARFKCLRRLAEIAQRQIRIRQIQVHLIECIECFQAQL